jgi:hypothetical protein
MRNSLIPTLLLPILAIGVAVTAFLNQRIAEDRFSQKQVVSQDGGVSTLPANVAASKIAVEAIGKIEAGSLQSTLANFDQRKLDNALDAGYIFVGNSDGEAAPTAVSGDLSLSESGVFSLNAGVISSVHVRNGSLGLQDLGLSGCTTGEVIKASAEGWACGHDADSDTLFSAGAGISIDASHQISLAIGAGLRLQNGELTLADTVVSALGAVDAKSKNALGASIAANVLYLQTADAFHPGVVSNTTQTIGGLKTFADGLRIEKGAVLAAGTAAAGTAPLKFTAGTTMTVTEDGAMEFDGTTLYISAGGTRYALDKKLTTTATLDFPSVSADSADLTVSVPGAAAGDTVTVGVPVGSVGDGQYFAWVSAADTVTIRFSTAGSFDPPSGTFRVDVSKN